jgi:hypothetical protein
MLGAGRKEGQGNIGKSKTPGTTAGHEVQVILTIAALKLVLQEFFSIPANSKTQPRRESREGPKGNVKTRTLCQRRKECATLESKAKPKSDSKSNANQRKMNCRSGPMAHEARSIVDSAHAKGWPSRLQARIVLPLPA